MEETYPPHKVSDHDNYIRAINHLHGLVHDRMDIVFAFDGRSSQNFKDAKGDASEEPFDIQIEMDSEEETAPISN